MPCLNRGQRPDQRMPGLCPSESVFMFPVGLLYYLVSDLMNGVFPVGKFHFMWQAAWCVSA